MLTVDYAAASQFLIAYSRYVLVCHQRPDGDALGCVRALAIHLRRAGRTAEVLLFEPPPDRYAFLFADEPPLLLKRDVTADQIPQLEALIVCDTCAYGQLEPIAAALRRRTGPTLVIDHHRTRDGIGTVRLIDETASAVGVMVAELLEADGGVAGSPDVAEALFAAIASDTGWFRFANTDARTLSVAGRLVAAGIDVNGLYRRMYQTDRPQRLALLGRALGTLTLHDDGRIGVFHLTRAMFEATGADESETENFIDEPQRIGSLVVTILLVEMPDRRVRVSLRSRHTVAVDQVAAEFGGGGHARAAGARVAGSLEEVRDRVLGAVRAAFGPDGPKRPSPA
jgi:phosphoesterase RecJ-like protein